MALPDPTPAPLDLPALLRRLGPQVYGLCRRLDPDPDDAYQAVWERVLQRWEQFDPRRGDERAWVLTLTHRLLVDRHRRRKAQGTPVALPELPAPAAEPGQKLDAARRQARLEQAVQALPEAQRRVVVMHHLRGVDLETLANDEGVPVGTIKSRLHRGRARLLMLLEDR